MTLVQLKGSRDEGEEDQRAHPTQRRYCVYVCYAMHHNSSKKKKSGCCQERAVLDPMTIREIHAGQRVTHTTETTVGSNAITSRYSLVKDAFLNPNSNFYEQNVRTFNFWVKIEIVLNT